LLRNRCRRMLDVYGSLVRLCKLTPVVSGANPNAVNPDHAPGSHHVPHDSNVQGLAYGAQQCLTPGTSYPTPTNTCPGLMGWFTVVWNACMFTSAPGVGSAGLSAGVPHIPVYFNQPSAGTPNFQLGVPNYLCGTSNAQATGPGVWNTKGTAFRSSRCRRALDQFGRVGRLCSPPQNQGTGDNLRWLAINFGMQSPYCGLTA